jgi:hypothetical protein
MMLGRLRPSLLLGFIIFSGGALIRVTHDLKKLSAADNQDL